MSNDDRQRARDWWRTEIIDIQPGAIRVRGYPIEQLIGEISFPAMIWLMLKGDLPTAQQAELLGAALVAGVDHGPQAPSIAIARMAVTCGLDLNNAMASAVNVLGDVHGGAGQQSMELYAEVAAELDQGISVEKAVWHVVERFFQAGGQFLPGFGHRFHYPIDPRAQRLLAVAEGAAADKVVEGRFIAIGRAVADELAERRSRPIPMNVDGATAVIFSELGFAPSLGRGLFVLSRSVGILAHAWEESVSGARIKGPTPPDFLYEYSGPAKRDLSNPE